MKLGLGIGTVDGIPFVKLLGHGQKVGTGSRLYTYTVFVERGTNVGILGFARRVEETLGDKRSWIRAGEVSFKRVESGANSQLVLATPDTVDKLCFPLETEGEVSCCQGTKVVINVERWKHAVPHWTGTVETYRQMVVNHEWGHRIGKPHRWCQKTGEPAAVMQQQTYGLQGCTANSWPLASEL